MGRFRVAALAWWMVRTGVHPNDVVSVAMRLRFSYRGHHITEGRSGHTSRHLGGQVL